MIEFYVGGGRGGSLNYRIIKKPSLLGLIHPTGQTRLLQRARTISLEENNWNWMPDLRAKELVKIFTRVVII